MNTYTVTVTDLRDDDFAVEVVRRGFHNRVASVARHGKERAISVALSEACIAFTPRGWTRAGQPISVSWEES
jgi:hypothetical protein